MHVHTALHMCEHMSIYVGTHLCVNVCKYTYVCVHTPLHMCAITHICMCPHLCARVSTCMYVRTHLCARVLPCCDYADQDVAGVG